MTITKGKVRFTPSEMEMLKEENIDLESHGFVKTNKNKRIHEYYVPISKKEEINNDNQKRRCKIYTYRNKEGVKNEGQC